jgi:hypothetical protein
VIASCPDAAIVQVRALHVPFKGVDSEASAVISNAMSGMTGGSHLSEHSSYQEVKDCLASFCIL